MHIWFDFLDTLPQSLQNWVKDISLLGFDARNIYLKAKTPFHILWFNEHLEPKFLEFLQNNKKNQLKIHFEINKNINPQSVSFKDKIIQDNFLNPLFTKDNFYFSKENALLKFAIDSKPKLLYLYGEPGSGKTHLLHTIAHHYQAQAQKIALIETPKFVWHFTTAIRTKQMDVFRNFYRNLDAFFLDDIEYFEGKAATQEEFFHLFNVLHLLDKPMCFTARKPPEKLQNLPNRILTRFAMGLVVPIHSLKISDLKNLLDIKSKKLNFTFEEDVFEIFQSLNDTAKAMQAFETLALRLHQNPNKIIKKAQVEQLLQDILTNNHQLDSNKILQAVAATFHLTVQDLLSNSKRFAKQRAIAMFYCRNMLDLSFAAIGKIFAKNHSTVISAIKNIASNHPSQMQKIEAILNK